MTGTRLVKKVWSSCIEESRGALEKVNISSVCRYFEKSRQAYYQRFMPKSKKELISEEELLKIISKYLRMMGIDILSKAKYF
ncbi:hypothetical protein LEP1GSC071_2425 [Leptospira santarosai str. JET]|nr:hypothetical protein LEP1GSC071_2425 [Leptospira santarosai str. JET]EPG80931.1 hypothetical protein LEP1GSC048_2330 [Leptospira santarosai serovar Shermani str. 1342KT]